MTAGLIFDSSLISHDDCPIAIPATLVPTANKGIIIAQINLALGQVLQLRSLYLHFVKFATFGGAGKINTGLPLAYVGLYYDSFEYIGRPAGKPSFMLGAQVPSCVGMDLATWADFYTPGLYSFMLVNNAGSSDIIAAVTGAVRIAHGTS